MLITAIRFQRCDLEAPLVETSVFDPDTPLSLDEVMAFPRFFADKRVLLRNLELLDLDLAGSFYELRIRDRTTGRVSRSTDTPGALGAPHSIIFAAMEHAAQHLMALQVSSPVESYDLTFVLKNGATEELPAWMGIVTDIVSYSQHMSPSPLYRALEDPPALTG